MSIIKNTRERLIGDKEQKLLELDSDRFYVENIRSFYNLTTPVARFLCELAVKQGLFNKRIGLTCPNEGCGCMIKSYAPGEKMDKLLTCKTCEIRGTVPCTFPSDSLERDTYYQLRTKVETGLTGEIQLIEPKETRETEFDILEEARKALYYDLEKTFRVVRIILYLRWKSMFLLTVLVTFIIVLVFLFHATALAERVLWVAFDASSGVGESHPHALPEPYVNVSVHTAPIIQPKDKHRTANEQITSALVVLIDEAIGLLCADAYTSCISFVPILSAGCLRP